MDLLKNLESEIEKTIGLIDAIPPAGAQVTSEFVSNLDGLLNFLSGIVDSEFSSNG